MTTGFSVHSIYLFKNEGDNVLNVSLSVILIVSLIIITGFIYLARIIMSQQKKLSELVYKVNEKDEKIADSIDNFEADNIDNFENEATTINDTKNTSILQKYGEPVQAYGEPIIVKEKNQEHNQINHQMLNPHLHPVFNGQNDGGEVPDYHEANIVKVNKTDERRTVSVSPNGMSLNGSQQFYTLDIVVEKTPISKAIKNDFIEGER